MEHAVDAHPDAKPVFLRFQMDIRCAVADGLSEQEIRCTDDGSVAELKIEIFDLRPV